MMVGQELFVSAAAVVVVLSLCVTSILANRRIKVLEMDLKDLEWASSLEVNELRQRSHWMETRISQLKAGLGSPSQDSPSPMQTSVDVSGLDVKEHSSSLLSGKDYPPLDLSSPVM